ncbi:MAG: hypothetical protein ACT4PL_14915 [Phycisphaerales bacterium]
MTALQAVAARHSFLHGSGVQGGLFAGVTSAYRKVATKVMATSTPRQQTAQGRSAGQANGLLREHNAFGNLSL